MDKIKACVIGAGVMGMNHIKILSDLEGVELVGVSDVSKENLEKARKFCKNTYTDYKEMIDKESPTMACIVVPTSLHFEVAEFLIRKKINILIEKPITEKIADAKKIIALAKEYKIKATVGHIERFNPAIQELKKEISKGKLGRPFKVDVHRVGPFPKRIRDVGVVIDLAVHDIDIIRYILGDEVERVYAEVEKNIHTTSEDILSAVIRMKNKTICHLNVNWLTPKKVRTLHVVGEKGMFVADYLERSLYLYENDFINTENFNSQKGTFEINEGKMIKYNTKDKDLLTEELKDFVNAIIYDKEPLITLEDGMKAIEIAHCILESAEKKAAIYCSKEE